MKNTLTIIISGMLVFGAANTLFASGGSKKADQTSAKQSIQSAQVLPAGNTTEPTAMKASGSCALCPGEAMGASAELKAKDCCPGKASSASVDAPCAKASNAKLTAEKAGSSKACSPEAKEKCATKAQATGAQTTTESGTKKVS